MNDKDVTIVIRANASQFQSAMKAVSGVVKDVKQPVEEASKSFNGLAVVAGAVGGIVSTVFSTAISTISSTISDAVKRVDTLKNADRAFQNMGFSAQDTAKMMDKLKTSVLGLPTSLSDAVSNVELLASSMGDIGKSQQVFQALNDGILGFGGTSEQVNTAVIQLSQAFAGGKVMAQDWNSMLNAGLGPALNAVAKNMGVTTAALKSGLSDGSISVGQFQDQLISLDKNGGGGMASLQKVVKDSTSGIGTGIENMKTAITRGIADIITAVGQKNISDAIAAIGKTFEDAGKNVASIIKYVEDHKGAFSTLAITVGTLAAGIVILNAYLKTAAIVTTAYTAVTSYLTLVQSLQSQGLGVLKAAWMALNIVMDANPIGLIIVAIVALVAGLVYFFTQTTLGKQIVQNVFNAIGSFIKALVPIVQNVVGAIGKFFGDLWNGIAGIFKGVVGFFKGVWDGVVAVFNAVIGFFQQWGLTILAVIFWPFSLAIGLIIANWSTISAFFQGVWNGIVAVFTPVINFFVGMFNGAWEGIKLIWGAVVWYYTTIWNGIVAVFSVVSSFFASVFTSAWNSIVVVWNIAAGFFGGVWNGIVAVFSPVISWLTSVFQGAWNGIKAVFSTVGSFFQGIWNNIVGIFTRVGTAVGDAISGAVKGVVNGILSGAEGIINGFVGSINGVTSTINKIPGVHIGTISQLHLPRLATGGIVQATSGGANITVAEGGQDEWVVPESKMASVVRQLNNNANQSQSQPNVTYNQKFVISITVENDGTDFSQAQAESMGRKITDALRAQGLGINEMGSLRV